jgi:hypothetical protein
MLKRETVDRALAAIKGYAQYEYFFDRLNSPAWLEPLRERGFFKSPQKAERVDPYVRFPFWPESRYLVRIAKVTEAQASVLAIALAIPSSDNSRIYDDIAEIALTLPPASSARLVPKLLEGIRLPIKLLLKDRIGGIIVYLAAGGEGQAAKTLAEGALALAPDPNVRAAEEEVLHFPEPQPLFEDFYYQRIVARAVPALVGALGFEAVQMFADLLDQAIRLSQKKDEGETNGEDYMYIAHPAIESGSGRDDVPGILLYGLRDASEQLLKGEPGQLAKVMEAFETRPWTSFLRLRLHLCRVFLESGGLPITEALFRNPEILNRGSLQHEAVLLLKSSFARWSEPSRERLLRWIDQGWPEANIRRWLEFSGQEVTDDNIRRLDRIWKRDHYAVLQGQLPGPYQRKLDELVSSVGPARDLGEPRGITGGAFGAVSPKAPEEFGAMSVAEIIEFLATWTPGSDMFGATAEGAGRDLGGAVAAKLDQFVAAAGEFRRLDPTYVRALFAALTAALKQKLVFDWKPVLDLAAWVASQPREIPGKKGGLMVADLDWGWSRNAIIDLLTTGLGKEPEGRLTLDLRPMVWEVLRPLTDDPNPTVADETPDPEKSASPVLRKLQPRDERAREPDLTSISINSTRGRAMHAVFDYARWVRLCSDAAHAKPEEPSVDFGAMPEVRDVLEDHLDVAQEPTRTIRSVYGDHLTLMAWLDWNWFQANLGRILPLGDADYPFFSAAWRSFVVFNQPNTTLLRAMIPCYRKAVDHLGKDVLPRHSVKSPEDGLAEHLMANYWHEALEFGAADELLDAFFAGASNPVRGHAIWYIGISVAGWKDEAPPEVYARLQALFDRRLAAAAGAPAAEEFSGELANFGHWFTSEKFEETWSIHTLLAALRLSKKILPEMNVVERLSELCPRYPVECVACLRLIIEGDKEGWILLGVEDKARALLSQALAGNHPDGSLSARRLVEELIAKGHFGFRSLLN